MQDAIQKCFGAMFVLAMTLTTPNAHAQTPRYDLLLKGGHVIDPANHIDGGFRCRGLQRKIAAVEKIFRLTRPGKLWMSRGSTLRLASSTFTLMWATEARR